MCAGRGVQSVLDIHRLVCVTYWSHRKSRATFQEDRDKQGAEKQTGVQSPEQAKEECEHASGRG